LRRDLGDTLPADVRLFDAGTGGMEVMFQARGARQLIIVDAMSFGHGGRRNLSPARLRDR
jgi:Ni,Fe-hydrogenase maturation factor